MRLTLSVFVCVLIVLFAGLAFAGATIIKGDVNTTLVGSYCGLYPMPYDFNSCLSSIIEIKSPYSVCNVPGVTNESLFACVSQVSARLHSSSPQMPPLNGFGSSGIVAIGVLCILFMIGAGLAYAYRKSLRRLLR